MKTKLSLLLGVLLLSALLIVPAMAQDDDQPAPQADQPGFGMGPGMGMGHGMGMGRGMGMGMRQNWADQLDLTDAQKDQMRELRFKHQKEMIKQRADLRVARLELQELIRSDADRGTINSKIDEIGKLETSMEKARVANRLDMRSILTPEQREKIKDRPMMGRGMRGDGGGPRGMRNDCDGTGPKAPRGFGRGMR